MFLNITLNGDHSNFNVHPLYPQCPQWHLFEKLPVFFIPPQILRDPSTHHCVQRRKNQGLPEVITVISGGFELCGGPGYPGYPYGPKPERFEHKTLNP